MWPCVEHDVTPWTPMAKPLSESKVAMVSTAGLHLRGDQPFVGGDQTYRVIPSSAKANDISLSRIGLDLKAVVEQFREQVQNIE